LADNREKISATDFDKYNSQYEYMKKICEEYANEKEDDSEEVKRQRFDYISDLMLKVSRENVFCNRICLILTFDCEFELNLTSLLVLGSEFGFTTTGTRGRRGSYRSECWNV